MLNTNDEELLYYHPQHYDQRYRNLVEDIPFLVRQVEKSGTPVLELGCGTGRILFPLAEKKFSVTGIEVSHAMLKRAKQKAKEKKLSVELMQGDCCNFSLGKKFQTILLSFNFIAHLRDNNRFAACCSCIQKHLAQGGKVIIDYINPDVLALAIANRRIENVVEYPHPEKKGIVKVSVSNNYDAATQINHIYWHYTFEGEEEECIDDVQMRIYFPLELDAFLQFNGFTIEEKYGNYDESPFISSSPKQLFVCSLERNRT
ncbi:MAG: class I SAM-dependent methyltransferase [Ignavibacteria bacterium]|nr:class I SAM-dependent methyltransferase [Ignavibacteria bacterium]